jgi:copper chaperone CopZ
MAASKVSVLLLVVLGLVVSGCGGPDIERTTFTVEGMHCEACSSAIVGSMEKIDGVVLATADHESGQAVVSYRAGSVEVEQLEGEIEELGYTVTAAATETIEEATEKPTSQANDSPA